MIRYKTVGDLKRELERIPDELEIGTCAYDGGMILPFVDSYLERLNDNETMFVLYTPKKVVE